MGIYIKGMEMPTDCHNCPLGFGGGCYCGTSADEYICPDHGRAEWCPLIPVPKHGRLIDADALMHDMDSFVHKTMVFGGQYVYSEEAIKNAPTIIEGDEE